jgi:selenocysteine-specific translation elongation factor
MEIEIGKITHYFDKIGVAVIKLSGELKKGEKIKIKEGENEFEQVVDSMQIEYQPVERAMAGQEVAVKVSQPVKEKAIVYKVEE